MTHKIDFDRIICPGCGWTGEASKLSPRWGECPRCSYEMDDGALMTVKEVLANTLVYDDVRLDMFLETLLKPNEDSGIENGYIGVLRAEIEKHERLLAEYIDHKRWKQVGYQQEFISGLAQALYLVETYKTT